jgi:capsular polysaccharide transport system permease protein
MSERVKNISTQTRHIRKWLDRLNDALGPEVLLKNTFLVAATAIVLAAIYWSFIASDRYVSEATIEIERTDLIGAGSLDFSSLITGVGGARSKDQLLLREYLRSLDMLKKLDEKLNLREHYSDTSRDPLFRMWGKDRRQEIFYQYYLSRTSVELDEYSGLLRIKVQAYEPKMAKAIADLLVSEGERYMNELGHAIARDQVGFLDKQVTELGQRAISARQDLLAFQNAKGMISPQSLAETLQGTVNRLESKLTDLKARRAALLGYLSPEAPDVIDINLQIQAIEKQLLQEQERLTSPKGKTLNVAVEEYQRLEMAAKFSEDVYKTALVALERGRVEALRTLKKVAILQSPSLPDYPLEPRRIYNIIVFSLVALLLAGIVHLLAAIIRDHRD